MRERVQSVKSFHSFIIKSEFGFGKHHLIQDPIRSHTILTCNFDRYPQILFINDSNIGGTNPTKKAKTNFYRHKLYI